MLLGLISDNPYLKDNNNNNNSTLNYISDFENNYKKNEIREKIGNYISEYIKINDNNFNEYLEKSISKIPYLYKWGFLFIEILKIKFINKTIISKFHNLIIEDKKTYEIKYLDNQNITNNNNNILLGKKRNLSPIKKNENINPNIKISPNKKNTSNNNILNPNKKINEIFKPLFIPKDFSNASKIIETQRKINFETKNSYSSLSLPTSSSSKISIHSKDNTFSIPSSFETMSSFSNSNFFNFNRNNSDLIQENYSYRDKDNLSLDSSFIFSRNDSFSNLSETNKKSYNGINYRLNNSRLERAIIKSTSSKKNYHSKSNSLSKLETAKKMIEKNENFSFDENDSNEKKSINDNKNKEIRNIVQDNFYDNSPIVKKKIEKNKNLIDSNNTIIAVKTPEKNNKNDDYEKILKDKCKKNLHAYFSQKQIL